jgi:beta-phosphoglucomutase
MEFLRGKRFFVWDFDGSFCNTERLHYLAYRAAFREWSHDLAEEGYYREFTHSGDGAKKVIERHGLAVSPEDVMLAKKRHYMELIATAEIPPFPGMPGILRKLSDRGTLAIASNSPRDEIDLILSRTGLSPWPRLVVGKEPTLRKKPHPDIFLRAFELLAAAPGEVLVFEDSQRGLEAAARAGAEAVLLRTEFNGDLEFTAPYVLSCTHAEFLEALVHVDG